MVRLLPVSHALEGRRVQFVFSSLRQTDGPPWCLAQEPCPLSGGPEGGPPPSFLTPVAANRGMIRLPADALPFVSSIQGKSCCQPYAGRSESLAGYNFGFGGGKDVKKAYMAVLAVWVASSSFAGEKVRFIHSDAVGTVRAVTDEAGNVVERHDHLPFGEEWCGSTVCGSVAAGQPKRFTGKERDVETGLDYFGARYYRGSLGRFTTVDPGQKTAENLIDPQRWNRYGYVRNNPFRYVDPDGRVLVLAGSQSARTQASNIANSGMFGQQLAIAPNGVSTLKSTSVQGPPTEQQQAMAAVLKTAIDDPRTTAITLSEGSSSTAVGSFLGRDVDVRDVAAFGTGPVATAPAVFGHEIAEQFVAQTRGLSVQGAHFAGTLAQDDISGWKRGMTDFSGLTNLAPVSGTTRTRFTRGNQTRDVQVDWKAGNVTRVTQ